jgi:hypothetical protein
LVAFLWFLYDFLRNLQDSAKLIYYLRLGFTGRSLEFLFLSRIGPWFMKNTLEITKEKQCSPLAMEAAVPAEIGRLRWGIRPGKEWGRKRGSPVVDLWPERGGGAPVVGRPAAYREPGRGEPCSGGLSVWEETRVAPGGCMDREELRGGAGLRQDDWRRGLLGRGRTGRTAGACCGRARAGRCAAL